MPKYWCSNVITHFFHGIKIQLFVTEIFGLVMCQKPAKLGRITTHQYFQTQAMEDSGNGQTDVIYSHSSDRMVDSRPHVMRLHSQTEL